MPDNLVLFPIADFGRRAAAVSRRDGIVALCRLDQPVPPEALARAETALHETALDAVTLMRGHRLESLRPEQPYVRTVPELLQPESEKTGNARALMALAQDSNAGFVVMRAACAGVLARLSPSDPQLSRLKDIELYIHEVLLDLSAEGHRFELIPDCLLPAAELADHGETYALPRLGLAHLMRSEGLKPGSEMALLSRLSVEIFAGEVARGNARHVLSGLSARLGEDLLSEKNWWPPSQAFATYARVAHAAGRPDLGLSLMARSLSADNPFLRSQRATPGIVAMQQAMTVDLCELFAQGKYTGLNVGHPWSLRFEPNTSALQVHPNGSTEGDATLIFGGLSFPGPVVFSSEIELPATARGPVSFEFELHSKTDGVHRHDWVLQPGQRKMVEVPLPDALRQGCDAIIATRMTRRRDSTEGSNAKWYGPAFRPR